MKTCIGQIVVKDHFYPDGFAFQGSSVKYVFYDPFFVVDIVAPLIPARNKRYRTPQKTQQFYKIFTTHLTITKIFITPGFSFLSAGVFVNLSRNGNLRKNITHRNACLSFPRII
jgi:hypothetical protein